MYATVSNFWTEEVPLSGLPSAYTLIERSLQRLSEKQKADWIPAQFYRLLHAGDSSLLLILNSDRLVGFYISSIGTDKISGRRLYEIQALSIFESGPYLQEVERDIIRRATSLACDRIVFSSSRAGFAKRMNELGWTVESVCYSKEITDGF